MNRAPATSLHHPLRAAVELSHYWSQLHEEVELRVRASEAHFLRTLALALDDDVASLLLLKKLQLARELGPAEMPGDAIVMNSRVAFQFAGQERRCRLVHPSTGDGESRLSVGTREGAGLIGLCEGQAILWPDRSGALRELRVRGVDNSPSAGRAQLSAVRR